MKKILSVILALALCLSLLAACSGNQKSAADASPSPDVSETVTDTPAPSGEPSEEPSAEPSGEPTEEPSGEPTEEPAPEPSKAPAEPVFALSSHDFTLFSAGSSWTLGYTADPTLDAGPVYTSSDESVAVVDGKGTVTAVAPGRAVITASCGELTDTCIVRCRWETAPDSVDLAAFAQDILSRYQFGFLELVDPSSEMGAAMLENYYSDLAGLSLNQTVVYICMMSMNNGEFALVEAANADDAAAAAAAFQARIDMMANGGAWYPEPTRRWSECSTVVTNGNYVMMVVSEQYADIVSEFNALF